MSEDWGAVRDRLEYEAEHAVSKQHRADIRAALERAEAAEAEVKRLRDIISPGDAAAYEEGMAALEAKLARVKELHQRGVNPQGQEFCTHCVRIGWPCQTLAAAKGEK